MWDVQEPSFQLTKRGKKKLPAPTDEQRKLAAPEPERTSVVLRLPKKPIG